VPVAVLSSPHAAASRTENKAGTIRRCPFVMRQPRITRARVEPGEFYGISRVLSRWIDAARREFFDGAHDGEADVMIKSMKAIRAMIELRNVRIK
jgi:hypothetical protein